MLRSGALGGAAGARAGRMQPKRRLSVSHATTVWQTENLATMLALRDVEILSTILAPVRDERRSFPLVIVFGATKPLLERVRYVSSVSGGSVAPDQAFVVDSVGRFALDGTHTREHGGPIRSEEKPEKLPARYTGTVVGDAMTLTVSLTSSKAVVGTFTLTRGRLARVFKCV